MSGRSDIHTRAHALIV